MNKIPTYRSMNFSIYSGMLDRYKDSEDIMASCRRIGLNGLEVIRAGESDRGMIRPGMVNGVHLYFHIFWMDWWRHDYSRMDEEFDSREQMLDYFGGEAPEPYLNSLRDDLRYAEEIGAKYVVFHVAEVTLRESYEFRFRYTDEEIVDASLEVINLLLDERDYPFDFMVENLWWRGLTLLDAKLTRRLLDGMHTEKKGVMLDTGHFMNTNCNLVTPEDAVAYLHAMLDAHEREGLLPFFKGMHLQMSLSGEYVRNHKAHWRENPLDLSRYGFYELFKEAYDHACRIDQHRAFLGEGVREFVERVNPRYLTMEYSYKTREEYEEAALAQSRLLGYL